MLNFGEIGALPAKLSGSAQALGQANQRLTVQSNRLIGQQGFGIPQISSNIVGIGSDLNRLSQDINQLSEFLRSVHDTTADAERNAYRALGGDPANGPQPLPPPARVPGGVSGPVKAVPLPAWLSPGGISRPGTGVTTLPAWVSLMPIGAGTGIVKSVTGLVSNVPGLWRKNANADMTRSATTITARAESSLWSDSASFEHGDWFRAGGNVNVGRVHASVESSASLGRSYTWLWNPEKGVYEQRVTWANVGVAASVGVSLLCAAAYMTVGNSNLGATTRASGSVVGAQASGGARISVGEHGANVYADGRVMAYLARGNVSQSINLGPIRIGGSLYGYAGAAGVSGIIGVQDGQFRIGGTGALGVGGGGSFSVGLNTDFNWQGAGDFAATQWQNVQNLVGGISLPWRS